MLQIANLSNYLTTALGATKTYVDSSVGTVSIQVQNLSATPTSNTILHSITNTLEFGESFKIQDNGSFPIAKINNTDINFYRNQNLNATNIDNAGFITAIKFIKSGGAPTDFLKADGTIDSNTYVTSANVSGKLNIDGTNSMTGALNMGTTNKIINLATPTSNTDAVTKQYTDTQDALKLNLSGGKMSGTLDMNYHSIINTSAIVSSNYNINGGVANAVPWIDENSSINTAGTNLYCQSGSATSLQTLIDNITTGLGYSIQLSSGSFAGALTFAKTNVIICGTSCPLFAPTSTISSTFAIGSTSTIVTRLKVKDVVITGVLTFVSSATYQQCRYNFSNCEFQANVAFPTAVNGTSPLIHFFDCTFSGTTAMTLPNTTCTIVFTRCVFNNQAIGISAPYGYVTFRDCTNMNSLTLPAVYSGVNALVNRTSSVVATTVSATSISLGGASASFLMGNGSLNANSAKYPTFISSSFSLTIPSPGTGGSPTTVTVNYRKISNGTQTMVTLIFPLTLITNSTTPSSWASGVALPADIRPAIATCVPIAVRNGTTFTMGLLWIYTSGHLQISDLGFGNSFTTSGAICGINAPQQVTYVV